MAAASPPPPLPISEACREVLQQAADLERANLERAKKSRGGELRSGDLVRLRNLPEGADVRQRDVFAAAEGRLAYVVTEADARGVLQVRPQGGDFVLGVTPHYLKRVLHVAVLSTAGAALLPKDAVRTKEGGRRGRIARVDEDGSLRVQYDDDASVSRVCTSAVSRLSEEEERLAAPTRCLGDLLLPYQWRCVDAFVSFSVKKEEGGGSDSVKPEERRRPGLLPRCRMKTWLGVVPIGGGKSVIGMACICRVFALLAPDQRSTHCALVVAPKKIIANMWKREVQSKLRSDVAAFVKFINYEALASTMQRSFDRGRWGSLRVAYVYLDEIHAIRNDGPRAEAVRRLLAEAAVGGAGVTGTPLSTAVDQVAVECSALGLGAPYEDASFWRQPDVFNLVRRGGGSSSAPIFWVDQAEVNACCQEGSVPLPQMLPDHEAIYVVADGCRPLRKVQLAKHLDGALSENFGTEDVEPINRLYGSQGFLAACRRLTAGRLPPKPQCLLRTLEDLFGGRIADVAHRKVVVSFYHRTTGPFLEELLKVRLPAVAVFRLYGTGTTELERLQQSELFLAEEARLAVLLLAVNVGGVGLNLVKGSLSPSALIRYELSDSYLTDRQVIGRIARRGNVHAVQPVHLGGEGTLNGWRWEHINGHRQAEEASGVHHKKRRLNSGAHSIQKKLLLSRSTMTESAARVN
jgi:hypothetical protein